MKRQPRQIAPGFVPPALKRRATRETAELPTASRASLRRAGKRATMSASSPHSKSFGK